MGASKELCRKLVASGAARFVTTSAVEFVGPIDKRKLQELEGKYFDEVVERILVEDIKERQAEIKMRRDGNDAVWY